MAAATVSETPAEDGNVASTSSNMGRDITAREVAARFLRLVETINKRLRIGETINKVRGFSRQNPLTATALLVLATLCYVPVVSFILFASITTSLTFFSFLFIEGFFLTMGTMVLGSCLFFILAFFVMMSFGVGIATIFFLGTKKGMEIWRATTHDWYEYLRTKISNKKAKDVSNKAE